MEEREIMEERKNGKKKKRKEERNFIFKKHCIFFIKLSSFILNIYIILKSTVYLLYEIYDDFH